MSDIPAMPRDLSYESISPGAEASFSRTIGETDVEAFAAITGDRNPLHMDAQYAASTRFGDRIVHGMLVASFFSTLVGMFMPGRRALFLSQQLQFSNPVRLGERITFRGRVRRKTDSARLLDIETSAVNDAGEVKVRGSVQVMVQP